MVSLCSPLRFSLCLLCHLSLSNDCMVFSMLHAKRGGSSHPLHYLGESFLATDIYLTREGEGRGGEGRHCETSHIERGSDGLTELMLIGYSWKCGVSRDHDVAKWNVKRLWVSTASACYKMIASSSSSSSSSI